MMMKSEDRLMKRLNIGAVLLSGLSRISRHHTDRSHRCHPPPLRRWETWTVSAVRGGEVGGRATTTLPLPSHVVKVMNCKEFEALRVVKKLERS